MVRLENNFGLLSDIYCSIKSKVADEFRNTFHPAHINFPVSIYNDGNKTIVFFNLANYQSKTYVELVRDISEHVSYIHEVDLHPTANFGELELVLHNEVGL